MIIEIIALSATAMAACSPMPEILRNLAVNQITAQAQQYVRESDYGAAVSEMNTAIDLNSENPKLYILRGQIYLLLYEWDKSLDDYNTAIDLAPDDADAYFYRGVLYYSVLQTGQALHEDALADFRHYLELAPQGDHAGEARDYVDKIEAELAALNP